jgi:homopolymeric O-antigen transport system permease protein
MRHETLRELWNYRELFYFLAWRDVKVRYKQTALGVAWAVLQPLLTMLIFTLLFGNLAKMPSEGMPYPLFYFGALLPWMYFSSTLSTSGNSLVVNAHLISKVYFPRVILPSSAAISGLVDFGIGCILLFGVLGHYRVNPGWGVLMWPVLMVPLVALTLAVSMILAALNVRFRDIKYVLPFLIQLWLFATPVIYPTSMVPERYHLLVALNPMTGLIDAFRASLAPSKEINWNLLFVSLAATALIFVTAVVYFRRTERTFADIV